MQTIVPPAKHSDPNVRHDSAKAQFELYGQTMDCLKGYVKMVQKAEPSFRDTSMKFRAPHACHAGERAQIFFDLGQVIAADGSIMGTVNKAVVTFRAFFDDTDEDVTDQVRSGEGWVLKTFNNAVVEQTTAMPPSRPRQMQAELTDLLAETQHLG